MMLRIELALLGFSVFVLSGLFVLAARYYPMLDVLVTAVAVPQMRTFLQASRRLQERRRQATPTHDTVLAYPEPPRPSWSAT